MGDYFGIVAAGPFLFVSSWLLMLFAGGIARRRRHPALRVHHVEVVTIALWLAVAPAVGAIARAGRVRKGNPKPGR